MPQARMAAYHCTAAMYVATATSEPRFNNTIAHAFILYYQFPPQCKLLTPMNTTGVHTLPLVTETANLITTATRSHTMNTRV